MGKTMMAALAAAMLASTADSAIILYSYSPITDGNGPFSFSLDTATPVSNSSAGTFRASITNGTGSVSGINSITFYSQAGYGGLTGYIGPQLYTGSTDSPTYLTGIFNLTNNFLGPNHDGTGVLTVSGTVPEPASWAMMIGGMGMVGAAMRRRKVIISFA